MQDDDVNDLVKLTQGMSSLTSVSGRNVPGALITGLAGGGAVGKIKEMRLPQLDLGFETPYLVKMHKFTSLVKLDISGANLTMFYDKGYQRKNMVGLCRAKKLEYLDVSNCLVSHTIMGIRIPEYQNTRIPECQNTSDSARKCFERNCLLSLSTVFQGSTTT